MLSDTLAFQNRSLYKYKSDAELSWLVRGPALKKELKDINADIYCLQELDENNFVHDISPEFALRNYASIYKKRTGDKVDGCAIMINKNRFDIIQTEKVEYNVNEILSGENVGIIVLLRDKQGSNSKLCVATTHIFFNRKRGIIKIGQLDILLTKIKDVIKEEDIPIVLCGDFNSTPNSKIIQFIETGSCNLTDLPEDFFSGQYIGKSVKVEGNLDMALTCTSSIFSNRVHLGGSNIQIKVSGQEQNTVYGNQNFVKNKNNNKHKSKRNHRVDALTSNSTEVQVKWNLEFTEKLGSMNLMNDNSLLLHPFYFDNTYVYDENTITTQNRGGKYAVDYIFIGGLRQYSHKKLLMVVETLELPVLGSKFYLPSVIDGFASDHLFISTKLCFRDTLMESIMPCL